MPSRRRGRQHLDPGAQNRDAIIAQPRTSRKLRDNTVSWRHRSLSNSPSYALDLLPPARCSRGVYQGAQSRPTTRRVSLQYLLAHPIHSLVDSDPSLRGCAAKRGTPGGSDSGGCLSIFGLRSGAGNGSRKNAGQAPHHGSRRWRSREVETSPASCGGMIEGDGAVVSSCMRARLAPLGVSIPGLTPWPSV